MNRAEIMRLRSVVKNLNAENERLREQLDEYRDQCGPQDEPHDAMDDSIHHHPFACGLPGAQTGGDY